MDILTQEQWLLNAQAKLDALKKKIWEDSQAGIRIDQEERDAFAELQAIGLMLLQGFAAGAGVGDEGAQVTRGERTLRRSDDLHEKVYRSVFGTFSIWRWVYTRSYRRNVGGGNGRWDQCADASGGPHHGPVGGSGNASGFDTAGVRRSGVFHRALRARTAGRVERTVSRSGCRTSSAPAGETALGGDGGQWADIAVGQ